MENIKNVKNKFGLPIEFVEQAKTLGASQKKSRIEEISAIKKEKVLSAFHIYRPYIPNLKISEDQEYLTFGDFTAECFSKDVLFISKNKRYVGRMENISDLGEIFLNLEESE